MTTPVVIVGGGLAGLACARTLHAAGVPFRLLEASDRIGGRLKTDVTEGFRLDRGFQVYFEAYPNAQRLLRNDRLDLRKWPAGAQIFDGQRLLTLDETRPIAAALSPVLPLADKLRLLRMRNELRGTDVAGLRDRPDITTEAYLRQRGFSEDFFARFARPFFGGIFLDPLLQVSSRQFTFVFKMLSSGRACSPLAGIEAIPRQLAAPLPPHALETFREVVEIIRGDDGGIGGVRFATHQTVEADTVVLATDADVAHRLHPELPVRTWLASTAYYFETSRPVTPERYLVLNGTGRGRVNEVAPLSNLVPEYAPPGRHLISATVLGPVLPADSGSRADVRAVAAELATWFPGFRPEDFRGIRTYRITNAQLTQPAGPARRGVRPGRATAGLYLAGDYSTNSSIDGAIESGMRCANAILRDRVG